MNAVQLERARRFAQYRIAQMKREGVAQLATVQVGRTPGGPAYKKGDQIMKFLDRGLRLTGRFVCDVLEGGLLVARHEFANDIVNEGLNNILNVQFNAGTQRTTWFAGLIDHAGFTALADDDIYDDINQAGNGWDEFTSYTDANNGGSSTTRPEWPADNASGQSITNATTQAIYDVTASGNVRGIFVVAGTQSQTKGDHTLGNTLWSTAEFAGAPIAVSSGTQLKITYTINASHA